MSYSWKEWEENSKYCEGCIYRKDITGHLPCCLYFEKENKLRGCDPGKGCTKYKSGKGKPRPFRIKG